MPETVGGKVTRILKNAAGDALQIHEVSISGYVIRKYTYELNSRRITNTNQRDWGDWIFHSSNGRVVKPETFILAADRVVAEIEAIGTWVAIDAVNYDEVTFDCGGVNVIVDMADLPDIGDAV